MTPIYLDNNATTKVAPEVMEAMLPYFTELYGNPSSMHTFGGQVAKNLKKAREGVASILGAASGDEILFTSCGTESNATAVHAAIRAFPQKKHLITSTVEHPAIKTLFERLGKEGFRITAIPVDSRGRLDMDLLEKSLDADTALVSIMWANNETGTLFPVETIGRLCRQKGILFHTDAVQAVGKIPMQLKDMPVDLLSLSGHKLHAPKGVGALYIKKGTPFTPYLVGGHQEHGRRAGTENVASIIGLGQACELAISKMKEENTRVKALRDRLEGELLRRIPKCFVNGDLDNRLPNTCSISFEYIEGEAILLMMNQYGICASSGSACTSGSLEPSHVLRAMGVPHTAAHGTIRFSLSIYNTDAEIDAVIHHLPPIVARLREMSPFWTET
ncbi:cysteine desulfurase NifS [Desulfobotulus sp.]|jgi:cysteine desulfurase|uniref:cysteine desulfurase NifS n=1 Tax=Desulfobotulus sp. TaxID=1940337 RepID=UPI002A36AB12|nr:cysteine desulfurase NifS [Desulfobotulus sp.]MDY0163171.1 cysteine desulfurase NifS [Desulfobotulus sp.]